MIAPMAQNKHRRSTAKFYVPETAVDRRAVGHAKRALVRER